MQVRAAFTGNRATLERAIRGTEAGGKTALYTTIYVVLKSFSEEPPATEVRRRALVVLSDGVATTGPIGFEGMLDLAQRRSIGVYMISLAPRVDNPPGWKMSPELSRAAYEMNTLASRTGAQAFLRARVDDLGGIYRSIVDELSKQYTLGYVSSNLRQDGTFRRVEVQIVSPPGVRSRTRSGYFAPRQAAFASGRVLADP
jgi:VWFA-related protein